MIEYTATCLFGLEGLLGEEIEALGYTRTQNMDGRISFAGDPLACARSNINLRFAERVYVKLGSFRAETFDALFEGTRALPWEDWIGSEDQFPVAGHAIKSTLFSVPDCQKIIKKAISVRLGNHYGMVRLPETGLLYKIEFFLFKDEASLMIDLSGVPLHKRGYRPETVAAPLRETLAAAMVKLARPRENVLLWDPFCGSGTIAIEAAMQMKNITPGVNRRFSAEKYPHFPAELWERAREEAMDGERETEFSAVASDIDPACVKIAQDAAIRAGVEDCIKIYQMDMHDFTDPGCRGTIVTNPPYGERLMTAEEAEALYRDMGKVFSCVPNWQIYVITPHEKFPQLYGRRADKIRRLYNGMIPCSYYQFFKPAGSDRKPKKK